MNEGKSSLAKQLSYDLRHETFGNLHRIRLDGYRRNPNLDLPYLQTLDLDRLTDRLAGKNLTMPTMIEGICLRTVLGKIDRELDLVIFVKKLNSGLWPPQFDQEKYENDPRRLNLPRVLFDDELRYLKAYRPHEIADLCFEWTEPRTVTD